LAHKNASFSSTFGEKSSQSFNIAGLLPRVGEKSIIFMRFNLRSALRQLQNQHINQP
jgi:hypothetical protein